MRPQAFRDPQLRDKPLQSALRKLETWLNERRWQVEWSRKFDDHADFTAMKIVVNEKRTLQSQIFGIIHEIGHIMLSESPNYILRFPASDQYKNRRERRHETLRVRAEVLGEEWEAWTLGEQLARKMNLEIDYNALRASRDRDIKSYAKWLLE